MRRVELPALRFLTRSGSALRESRTLSKRLRCSSVFVSNRLKSLALLPELMTLIHYVIGATNVFGIGTGVSPLWIRKGSLSGLCEPGYFPSYVILYR